MFDKSDILCKISVDTNPDLSLKETSAMAFHGTLACLIACKGNPNSTEIVYCNGAVRSKPLETKVKARELVEELSLAGHLDLEEETRLMQQIDKSAMIEGKRVLAIVA